jgi:putative salt-induced outer membrane protein YdiY
MDHLLHKRIPMKTRILPAFITILVALAALPHTAFAQASPPPPPGWAGSAGAGLAMTQGNNDTSTVNAAFELKHDSGGPLVFKSNGLLLWSKAEELVTSDRLALDARLERKLTTRTALFGQTQYLRDKFKSIEHLFAPTVGVSQQLLKSDRSELGVDAAVGIVFEQNPGLEMQTDGAVTAGQQFTRKLTSTTELKEKVAALWKMDDFGDALYTLGVGLAASISTRTQMKVEFLDTYKAEPPLPGVEKNDIAVLLSFVYKFE